ncbi:major facilitator superfamily domain-containing protein [Podospora fimiseda]|uniref:Major facilitator superfamily domain-containing protein n=1 Tax=Podospora fimiseda TaxID=252190 RepID=A0AAN7BLD7_9PEZI|nr:major facilitator superfamily domain-containing protein [Podospora fimiseda]
MINSDHRLEEGLSPEQQHQMASFHLRVEPLSSPYATDTDETPSSSPPSRANLDAKTPIISLCLDFSTPLPALSYHPPIPPPSLTSYADPLTWPSRTKRVILLLSCVATFLCAYTAGSYSPPQHLIQYSISPTPPIRAVLVGITTFCVGFALAPMFLAPFSELNGRYPVFVVFGILYVAMQAVCGVVKTLPQMLVARYFVGVGASVFSTMVGGVISDIYGKKERNTPMAIFSGFVLAGTGVGPLVGAVMTQRLENEPNDAWKWVWWHQVLMGGLLMIALVIFFRESRGSVLLSRKARKLNQWYEAMENSGQYGVLIKETITPETNGDSEDLQPPGITTFNLKRIRWTVKDEASILSLHQMLTTSVTRPFLLLFTEPVVFWFSAWVSFAWGILYLTFGSIPLVFQQTYNFTLEQAGYVFCSLIIGSILGTLQAIWQERLLHHPKWTSPITTPPPPSPLDPLFSLLRHRCPPTSPESRLYFTCLSSTFLPLGLFIFGFTARPSIHFLWPCLGLVLATMGILSIYLAVFNYFADVYTQYASSALAAQSFSRNVLAGCFPLVTTTLFNNLGNAKAGGLLGGIAALLTVVPWVLVLWGEKIRARSPFAIVSFFFFSLLVKVVAVVVVV